jgi:histidinol-phosphate aminotransferase
MSCIKPHIRVLAPYQPPLEGRNKDFTLLDFNERTLPPPKEILDALKDYIDGGHMQRYPSYGTLQADLAKYSGVLTEQVLFTNGSDQGIDLVIRCCCEKGTEVVIPAPTFAMYEQAAESEGLTIVRPSFTREGGFPLKDVLAAVTPKTSLIVLSNPNNPTGTNIPKEAILECARKNPKAAILVDECYYEFMDAKETVKDEVANLPNLFVCRTFSKTWGIPALRMGYLISAKENVAALSAVRGPYDVNQLAVVATQAAMKNQHYVADYVEEVMRKAKPRLESFLDSKGIVYWPSWANFILCYFKDPVPLEKSLRARGILVRPKKDAAGVLGLRISIGTLAQIEKLCAALEELLPANGEPAAKKPKL